MLASYRLKVFLVVLQPRWKSDPNFLVEFPGGFFHACFRADAITAAASATTTPSTTYYLLLTTIYYVLLLRTTTTTSTT